MNYGTIIILLPLLGAGAIAAGDFLQLDGTPFLLLDGSNFLLFMG